jgi:hypothetical protein
VNAPIDMNDQPQAAGTPIAKAPCGNVRKALFLAQRDVGKVAKDSKADVKNKDGARIYSYAYTSSEDMIEHCRHALHEHGLSWELASYEQRSPLPGTQCPSLWGRFELCHAETGEVLEREYCMPIASRNDADKALSGAITYLLGQATRLLLLVPKVSEEDAKNNPDRRDRHVDDEQPRSERRVLPATPKPATLGEPPRNYTDGELKRLRDDVGRLVDLAVPLLDKKKPELRVAAGMPEVGTLDGGRLARYRKWLIDSIDIAGGVVPEWAREWDPLDQRDRVAELRDDT